VDRSRGNRTGRQVDHLSYTLRGRMRVEHEDGTTQEIGPGEVAHIPPGHDAWIIGDETYEAIDLCGGAKKYAVPEA
jgi:quercetin dioxygenase-like cupin family protein